MGPFKPGDRVRVVETSRGDFEAFECEGTIEFLGPQNDYPYWVIFDGWERSGEWGFDEFELEGIA